MLINAATLTCSSMTLMVNHRRAPSSS